MSLFLSIFPPSHYLIFHLYSLFALVAPVTGTPLRIIPFDYDLDGHPQVHLRYPRVYGNLTFPCAVCAGYSRPFTFEGRDFWGNTAVIGVNESLVSQSDSGSINLTVAEFTSRLRGNGRRTLAFSIGQRSSFIQSNGSVDFIHTGENGGFIRFNSTRNYFESDSCVEGSVSDIPNQSRYTTEITIEGWNESVAPRGLEFAPSEIVLGIPWEMFNHIRSFANATQTTPPRIRDCDSVLPRLPTIDIRFLTPDSTQSTIKLYPEDYVRRSQSNSSSCDLLVTGNYWFTVPFNPLMIHGLNMRFESQRIRFCDSAL